MFCLLFVKCLVRSSCSPALHPFRWSTFSWRLLTLWYIVFSCHPFTSLPVLALIPKDLHSSSPKLHICHRITHFLSRFYFLFIFYQGFHKLVTLFGRVMTQYKWMLCPLCSKPGASEFCGNVFVVLFFCQHGPKIFPYVKCLLSSESNPVPWLQAGVVPSSFTESFDFWQLQLWTRSVHRNPTAFPPDASVSNLPFFFKTERSRCFPHVTTNPIRHDHQTGKADTWIFPSPAGIFHFTTTGN